MKKIILAAFALLFSLLSCTRESVWECSEVRFLSGSPQTRVAFESPEGEQYPAIWTSDEEPVLVSLNSAAPVQAEVHPYNDGRNAWFSATFESSTASSNTFYAFTPSSAFVSISDGQWDYSVPSVQTPLPASPDPKAMVLSAASSTFEGLPREVELHFSHLTSYGVVTLQNFSEKITSLSIKWSEETEPLVINTSSLSDIWFSVKPCDVSGTSVKFIADTGAGTYIKSVTFPEGRNFLPGQVARFNVDMTGAAYQPASTSISILAIGNSFSVDAMQYLYGFLRQAGYTDIFLGNLYIGGCTLQTHASNIANSSAAYTYYTNSSGTWNQTSGYEPVAAIKSRKWDYVSMQQASGYSGVADSYDPYLGQIVDAVKANCPDATLIWHMTWAYQANSSHSDFPKYDCIQSRMYNAILNAVRTKVLSRGDFDFVIPCGTTVQNLRTSYLGDNITRDGYHMSYAVGRVATALTWLKQITHCPLDPIDLSTSGQSLNSKQVQTIKDAVEKACANPFEVTASAYPPELLSHVSDESVRQAFIDKGYDISKYRELDYGITTYAFYNSTAGSSLTSKAGGSTASNIDEFAATGFFSRDDLPVGTVLVLKKGYQYRPEAWTRLSAKNSSSARPGNVKADDAASIVEVTDSWWNGYAYRAFNLAESSNPHLTDERMTALRSCLAIFIPL